MTHTEPTIAHRNLMPITPEEAQDSPEVSHWKFLRALRASRLLSVEDIDLLERQTSPDQFDSLQSMLVEQGILTPYQLSRVKEGRTHGLVFGQYRILDELGNGGCGQVFKARHALMDRVVALKVMSPDLRQQQIPRELFVREVVATTRLSHPNIATAFDADEADGHVYFVMEFVEGSTLQSYVSKNGPLPIPLACSALLETAQALQHAHEHGLVHRDIKPANIMLPGIMPRTGPAGGPPVLVKVVDFGLARLRTTAEGIITTIPSFRGAAIGTPAYIAPEQITDIHAADIRSDLYSLGCTFYFALGGRLPFEGLTTELTLYMHQEIEPPPLRTHRPEVPARLAGIIHRLMAKNPAQRYQTPADLFAAVNDFVLAGGLADEARTTPQKMIDRPRPELPSPTPTVRSDVAIVSPAGNALVSEHIQAAEPSQEGLRRLWDEWCEVVEDQFRCEPPRLQEFEYRNLYRHLLAEIGSTGNGLTRTKSGQLLNIVEPWVSLNSLAGLDRRMLDELRRACAAANADVWGDEPPSSAQAQWGRAAGSVLIGLALCGLLWVVTEFTGTSKTLKGNEWVRPFGMMLLMCGAGVSAWSVMPRSESQS